MILLLDSSNTSLTVGIADDEKVIDSVSYEAWQTQSERMIPELDALMSRLNVQRKDITGVMVTIGPGSYTGVRIAITIAKTIGTALNVPVYEVSSLQAQKDGSHPSVCLINARSGRSYIGVYENEKTLLPDQIMTNDKVLEYIRENPAYSVCGNTAYLGIEGVRSDIAREMFSLKSHLSPIGNVLSLKPVYMKD